MKTFPAIINNKITSFEIRKRAVDSYLVAKILKKNKGVSQIRIKCDINGDLSELFDGDRIKFKFDGKEFNVYEMFGDNNFYTISPVANEESAVDVSNLEKTFKDYQPRWYHYITASVYRDLKLTKFSHIIYAIIMSIAVFIFIPVSLYKFFIVLFVS